jgi:hypothetical protein
MTAGGAVRAMEKLPDGQITFVPDVAMSSP